MSVQESSVSIDWHSLIHRFAAKWVEFRPVPVVELKQTSIQVYAEVDADLTAMLETYFSTKVPAIIAKYPQSVFIDGFIYVVYAYQGSITISRDSNNIRLEDRGAFIDLNCLRTMHDFDESMHLEGIATFMHNRNKERIYWSPSLGLVFSAMNSRPVFANSPVLLALLEELHTKYKRAFGKNWGEFKQRYETADGSYNPHSKEIVVPLDDQTKLSFNAHLQFSNGEPVLRFSRD